VQHAQWQPQSTVSFVLDGGRNAHHRPARGQPRRRQRLESGDRGVLGVVVNTGARGTVVVSVTPGQGAAAAGIGPGDVITSVAAIPVASVADLNDAMQDRRPGDDVRVTWHDAHGFVHPASVAVSAGPPA
jgi:S1-C subfamily serine protease